MAEVDLGKVVGPQGETGAKGDPGKEGPQGPPGPEGVVDGNSIITFVTPEAYQEPQSGDSIANLFGRFKRWLLNLQNNIGSLSSLKTPAKTSVVDGVNANYDSIAQLEEDVGNPTDLTTDAKEVVSAVNELNSALALLGTEIQPVKNSYGFGAFTGGYIQLGKVVCVTTNAQLVANYPAGQSLCTGLPYPAVQCAMVNVFNGATATYSRGRIIDGVLFLETAANTGQNLYISGSYLAK